MWSGGNSVDLCVCAASPPRVPACITRPWSLRIDAVLLGIVSVTEHGVRVLPGAVGTERTGATRSRTPLPCLELACGAALPSRSRLLLCCTLCCAAPCPCLPSPLQLLVTLDMGGVGRVPPTLPRSAHGGWALDPKSSLISTSPIMNSYATLTAAANAFNPRTRRLSAAKVATAVSIDAALEERKQRHFILKQDPNAAIPVPVLQHGPWNVTDLPSASSMARSPMGKARHGAGLGDDSTGATSPTRKGFSGDGKLPTIADVFDLAVATAELAQLYCRRLTAHLEFIVGAFGEGGDGGWGWGWWLLATGDPLRLNPMCSRKCGRLTIPRMKRTSRTHDRLRCTTLTPLSCAYRLPSSKVARWSGRVRVGYLCFVAVILTSLWT